MDGLFAGLGLADVHDDLARNIVSLRVSENLFDDLSADPAEQAQALRWELAGKPPLYGGEPPVIHRPFEEAAWFEAIGFPFRNWAASRYSDGRFGVWYGADSVETTVHETVHHWRHGLLADAGFDQDGVSIERKVYRVRCDAALIDLRSRVSDYPALVHPDDYSFAQQVGARLHREGHPGLVNRSARCAGDVYGVLNPAVLSQPRAACYLTYRLEGGAVVVEREPGREWLRL